MKYVYTEGPYKEFRGYAFANGKPVTVTDRGTLEAISKRPDFKVYEPPAPPPVKRPILSLRKK